MANRSSGCLGCLGSLVILTFFGSIFFGGGVLMRVAGFQFVLGNPVDQQRFMMNYMSDLEAKQKIAANAVQRFHNQLGQGQCEEIYEQANEILKSSQSQAELVRFCATVQREFGSVESTEQIDWWGQPANQQADQYILTRYNTRFSNASAQEIFVWLVKDDKAELVSYQVNPSTPPSEINRT
ncbi:hypothetical protein H6F67_09125 [Microcoleus sp. FACHB-1515]|uniref:hypothetical protein n=1 Tax=Cyanophyceae TaxID=3028117 RepID=UPI0016881C4B|nr:hypothetical protein [Microcoleus sp. FACHB-1515]MBD2090013.1 hypothetical protein [Microcoleus sp. FACHB-1515]